MPRRRLRREFLALEAKVDSGAQEREWRKLIDYVVHQKGEGPESIVEQLRLQERLRTLHARRDRYNQRRYEKKLSALLPLLDRRHLIAMLAIRLGVVEAAEGPMPRDLMIGLVAGDLRLTKKVLHELEGIYQAIFPAIQPWEIDQERIRWEKKAAVSPRPERHAFEFNLMHTPVPTVGPASIDLGFQVPLPSETHAPDHEQALAAARAAS